ncbi:tyrosine-type recombinase/integrase [Methylobacterium soli]|uniref:tyrosine-type recombinase/integrase n=1 Tax=Methylobacterium soli TaxID=553447 RepID=UPI00178447B2|nr:tyrosine-type recombinase/integrase [Methylobacterium soli]GJE44927.1 Tyrosine recombinase XerC [Methylobacterium soli]
MRHSLSHYDGLKGPKSAAGNRNVPMSAIVKQRLLALHRYMDGPSEGFVFIGRDGRNLDAIGLYCSRYLRAMKVAGLLNDDGKPKFTLHALRHAAASLLIAEGLSPLHIMSIMGHAEIGTTMNIYGHLFPEDVAARNSIDAIGTRFGATTERQDVLTD